MTARYLIYLLLPLLIAPALRAQDALKDQVRQNIANQYPALTALSDSIWSYEEIALPNVAAQ